jgi:uncharacterized protein (DUF1015 family)
MATVRPFRALRPVPEKAKDVASVPYDVVTTEEARELARSNPLSFLHVIRPEIDLPQGTDLYADAVYEKAKENFTRMQDDGVLIREEEPSLYIYKLREGEHEQVGLACCCSVDEYENDTIRKHEHTRKEKEDDRLRHMLTLSAHPGPVLMAYRAREEIDDLVRSEIENPVLYDFVATDGIQHTLWRVSRRDELISAFRQVSLVYIAPNAGKDEEFRFFLSVLFPAAQLRILPYNRYVSDLGDLSEAVFLTEVKKRFAVTKAQTPQPKQKGTFGMYLGETWYTLEMKAEDDSKTDDPVSVLDLSIFSNHLLEPVLGIRDQKKDKRIDFIGGAESTKKLERRVKDGGGVAFSFYPVSVDELLAVADAGMIMPPKSMVCTQASFRASGAPVF